MPPKIMAADACYFLGFDGGGTKTECVLADAEGRVLARASGGPSNPLRTGYTRAWFALSETADTVLGRQKIHAGHIRGICAGLGGAGRAGVVRRVTTFFENGFPNARVRVTTDLEVALEAAFGAAEGIILLAGTGSAAFGRDANGRKARAGGRGPWFSDEGSAVDIGRRAFQAVVLAEEGRGPATALGRILKWHQCQDWDLLLEWIAKNPDEVFSKTFPLVAKVADDGDGVAREILSATATSLAGLAECVSNELGWRNREVPVAKVGGVFGRSTLFDAAIDAEVTRLVPRVRFVPVEISPAEAAVRVAVRLALAKGNAA
jgi:N-acetylglucosamine kinase-like BadF-type ATPase